MTTTDGPATTGSGSAGPIAAPPPGLPAGDGPAHSSAPPRVGGLPAPPDDPAAAPPGLPPRVSRPRRALRALRSGRVRSPSTPFLLRLAMAFALVPVAAFGVAVHLGVERNDSTVRTVGSEATRGIAYAQALKVDLAELDEVVVRSLLVDVPLEANGFPADYNVKRAEVHEGLVLAAVVSSSGAAYEQPLANIDYVMSHYHALVKDAFAAEAEGETASALEAYTQAHQIMADTLLPEADFVDKANSYVLNDTYDTQQARSASTVRVIVMAWVALLAFLVLAQLLVVRRFRRVVNLGLALATVVAIAGGAFTVNRLSDSASHLTRAREQAFDSVHVLARARAAAVSARQAQGQFLLDPTVDGSRVGFLDQVQRLLRVQGASPTDLIDVGSVPDGAGGYLARVAGPGATTADPDAAGRAVAAFGAFLAEDTAMRDLVANGDTEGARMSFTNAGAYAQLDAAINTAQVNEQESFDEAAGDAADAARLLDEANVLSAVGVLLLALLGLFQRLREYRA
jgi:hypothetical protein